MAQGNTGQPTTLTNAHILVGDATNIAQDVAMTGDITITNAGVTTIKTDVALAGNPTTTTQGTSDNSTKIATTAFVKSVGVNQLNGASVDNTLPRFDGTSGTALQPSNIVVSDLDELYLYRNNEIADSTTSRTLSATVDMGCTIRFSNSSTITVTVPNTLPKGFYCTIIQGGTGQVQLSAASGTTIQNRLAYTATRDQYSVCTLEVTANAGTAPFCTWSGDTYVASTAFSSPILASLQQVSITIAAGATSNTATITSVNTAKAYCHWQNKTGQVSTWANNTCDIDVTLTNSTTVTATRNTSDASNSITVNCTVVEFVSGAIQNIQQGTVTLTAATSNTATITAVVLANSVVHYNGEICTNTAADFNVGQCKFVLTNTTTVTCSRATGTNNLTGRFVVIEFAAGVLASATQAISTNTSGTSVLSSALTAVDERYTMIYHAGFSNGGAATTDSSLQPASTVASPDRTACYANNSSAVINFQIAEFTSSQIKRITRSMNTLAATTTSSTTAISSANTVDTTKTLINWNGGFSTSALSTFRDAWCRITLTDANTITVTKNTSHATITQRTYFEIVEFQ